MYIDPAKSKTKLPLILKASLELFVKKGIDGTTTKQIAKTAGVAEGNIYRFFKGKESLAYYIFYNNLKEFMSKVYEETEPMKTFRAKLEKAIETFYTYFDKDRTLFTYTLIEQHQNLKRLPEDFKGPRQFITEILEYGAKKREIPRPADMELANAMLLGIILQPTVAKIYGNIKKSMKSHAKTVAKACFSTLNA